MNVVLLFCMASPDILKQAGIEHTPSVIDRPLADELEAECEQLLSSSHDDLYFISEWNPDELGATASVTTRNYPVTSLQASGLVTINKVLELHHPYLDNRDANVLINRQEPGASQVFHPDIVRGHQLLIYASDDGKFDFFPDHDASDFVSIDVNSGGLLKLIRPYIRHRGRNPSNHYRYVLVLSQTSELD